MWPCVVQWSPFPFWWAWQSLENNSCALKVQAPYLSKRTKTQKQHLHICPERASRKPQVTRKSCSLLTSVTHL